MFKQFVFAYSRALLSFVFFVGDFNLVKEMEEFQTLIVEFAHRYNLSYPTPGDSYVVAGPQLATILEAVKSEIKDLEKYKALWKYRGGGIPISVELPRE